MAKILPNAETAIEVWGRIAGFGALFGIVLWLLSLGIAHFIVEPLTCGIGGGASQCSQAIDVAGGIATVLVAVAAIFVGLWWRLARPAFVAIAAALMLWGLASWLTGLFWVEAVVWSALVGALVYLLFSWLNRTQSIALTIILTAFIVIAERIVLAL
jgi:hypothetical protein